MNIVDKKFILSDFQKETIEKINNLLQAFRERENSFDEIGSCPKLNIEDLKKFEYTKFTLSKEYGGYGISLYDLVLFQEAIAFLSGPTALSIGWHMGIVMDIVSKKSWEDKNLLNLFLNEIKNGKITNRAASEFATGSPTRGGLPQTTAVLKNNYYIINGEKAYTTLAPILDYFLVTATFENEQCEFLVPKGTDGISIDETSWDSVSMRGTASHILKLENVKVPKNYLTTRSKQPFKQGNGWLLHIPACYLGIANAAFRYAVEFAKNHKPNSLNHSIAYLPHIGFAIGEIELDFLVARHFIYSVCEKFDNGIDVSLELSAVKHFVTNTAIKIVDKSMKIVGAKSLSEKSPMWRYYINVRAGLHNPPMDDAVINSIAKKVIEN
ncbi:MAG: acyl-CoA/acyl-ACP dehydrogenase [Defluviitaleaceae bacterium]|nr:acyl-CoA/acyl-ACP dehydrogenase [Defluviitaleaceae bacterium]